LYQKGLRDKAVKLVIWSHGRIYFGIWRSILSIIHNFF